MRIMGSRIIFCSAFCVAAIVVILLASPNASHNKSHSRPLLDLSLYIQKPHLSSSSSSNTQPPPLHGDNVEAALIFHHVLTEGSEDNSKVAGKAQAFIIPSQQFVQSPFNVIYLTLETPERSGSLSLKAKEESDNNKDTKECRMDGGTGSFAFARGVAVFSRTDMGQAKSMRVTMQDLSFNFQISHLKRQSDALCYFLWLYFVDPFPVIQALQAPHWPFVWKSHIL